MLGGLDCLSGGTDVLLVAVVVVAVLGGVMYC